MAYVKQEYKKDVKGEIILYLSLATGGAIFWKTEASTQLSKHCVTNSSENHVICARAYYVES